jgi:hypothetical protein
MLELSTMKLSRICLFSSLIFFGLSVLLMDSVDAESPNNEAEIKEQLNEEQIDRNSANEESQPVKLELNLTEFKRFPVLLWDTNNNDLGNFFNSNLGDYGQKIIIEYRFDL